LATAHPRALCILAFALAALKSAGIIDDHS
jgi:hypothetical protein